MQLAVRQPTLVDMDDSRQASEALPRECCVAVWQPVHLVEILFGLAFVHPQCEESGMLDIADLAYPRKQVLSLHLGRRQQCDIQDDCFAHHYPRT